VSREPLVTCETGGVISSITLEESSLDGITVLTDPGARRWGLGLAFSDRYGGISPPPFDELNLAARVGDEPSFVAENRRRVARAAGFDIAQLALARQVHGADVLEVVPGDSGVVGEADVLVTRTPGVVIGVLTADCAAVVVVGERGMSIAHAGWRGLVAGAVERGIEAVGSAHAAWIGPSIHSCCYEVGPEVVDAFAARGLPRAPDGRHVDPASGAAHVLEAAGITPVHVSGHCTHHLGRYFSHRREGRTGRQGAFAWIAS
jgi:polyphenol oxidase